MVLAGIICGTISQTPGLDTPTRCNYAWVFIYFVTSAISVVATIHVLLCSVFINVFGQGIALRGPLGSMVKAVDGMVFEQQQILTSFIVGIVFFVLQEVGMFFIVMDQPFAILCSLIVLAGMGITYHYTLRIYNRFNWDATIDHWKSGEGDNADPAQRVQVAQDLLKKRDKDKDSPLQTPLMPLETSFAAYLTLKVDDKRERWQRHYFVLSGSSLSFFKDRLSQQTQPSEPLNRRPILLREYRLLTEPPFLITLLPLNSVGEEKAAWRFRCDTRSELEEWMQRLSGAMDPLPTQLSTIPEEPDRDSLSQW